MANIAGAAPNPNKSRHCKACASDARHALKIIATTYGAHIPGPCQKKAQAVRPMEFASSSSLSAAFVALRGYTPPRPYPMTNLNATTVP